MKPTSEQKQPLEDSKEGLHTQNEKLFGTLELWEDVFEKDCFYSLKAYTKDGLQTIVRTETPLKKDKENCEYILKAVNERKALLDNVARIKYEAERNNISTVIGLCAEIIENQ